MRLDKAAVPGNVGRTMVYLAVVGISMLGLSIAAVADMLSNTRMPAVPYIHLHMVLEISSIVVSFAVFTIGWYGYRQTGNRQDMFLAVIFLAVGAADLIHTLSYKGMPDFLGTNTVGKAAAYWLAARLIAAIGIFIVAFISPRSRSKWTTPGVMLPLLGGILIAVVVTFTRYTTEVSGLMYNDLIGLTPLKIGIEYLIIAILLIAFWAVGYLRYMKRDIIVPIRIAIILAIASEVCFTLYSSAYDINNLIGHVYKVVSYYFILQALFVSSLRRPYLELSYAKEQIQSSFDSIGEALGAGLDKDSTLARIASLVRQMFQADMAAIGEIKQDIIELNAFDGLNPGKFSVPVKESLAGEAFVVAKPVVAEDISSRVKTRPEFVKLGMRSLMWAPIVRDGRPVGVIYVGSIERGVFEPEDAEILISFGRHAAIAIGNAEHYEREHRIADTLQQVIFPPAGIRFGDFQIAGRYLPAWDEAQVGGDFYDYFDIGDGRLGIAIGDVSGKGLNAAVHTAIVKYSYQAYIRQGFGPADALRRVGEAFEEREVRTSMPEHAFITVFCAVLDSKSGRLTYANAGHEPPVKISSEGEITILDSTGPILGVAGASFEEAEVTLVPGDKLVLYTDGITEARAEGRLFGHEGLVDAIRSCADCSAEDLVRHVCEEASYHARGAVQDDVAIIALLRGDE